MPFVHVTFNLKRVATHELTDDLVYIGRSSKNHIVIDNPGVSATHARIVKEGEDYYIEDLGSTNGSYLGDKRIDRHKLSYGDVITIFKHQLSFVPLVGGDVPKAEKEEDRGSINQSATMIINRSQLAGLSGLADSGGKKQQIKLLISGRHGSRTFLLEQHGYCIGKSKICLIRTKGWFAPSISARLIRQGPGYLLVPSHKKEVKVNEMAIENNFKLNSGDTIDIRDLRILYQVE